jgi:peptide chain release factor subunit 1
MFDEEDLRELVEFQGQGSPVVSLYLDTDLTHQTKERCKLTVRELFRRLEEEVPQEDRRRVERFLDFEHDWQAKGIAAFTCQTRDFWRVFSVAVPLASTAFIGEGPNIKLLASLQDEFKPNAVALVGRDRARFFVTRLGEIVEYERMADEELPGRHKQGGWAAQRYQRHVDDHALHNLREAAELTAHFCEANECQRLILGGTEQNTSLFREILPKSIQRRVVGEISLDIEAPASEVLLRSNDIFLAAEREREAERIEAMMSAAAAGGRGVTGLSDTLAAAQEGRVQTLIMLAGYAAPAYRSTGCGYLTVQSLGECPFCGSEFERIADAVNLIVRRVVEDGGQVEVVPDNEALKQAGGIGALLRY